MEGKRQDGVRGGHTRYLGRAILENAAAVLVIILNEIISSLLGWESSGKCGSRSFASPSP
jgi:hypothetical protein